MICGHCDKPFEPVNRRARYCGRRCRVQSHRDRNRPVLKPLVCPECDETFMPTRPSAVFCGAPCRQRWWGRIDTARGNLSASGELPEYLDGDAPLQVVARCWPSYLQRRRGPDGWIWGPFLEENDE